MTRPSGPENAGDLVTLTEAAEALEVHYMTAYRYIRTGRMLATKRDGKWWVSPPDLAAVLAEGTGARRPNTTGTPRELLVEPFADRLLAGDGGGCWELITTALRGGALPGEVHERLLQAALVRIGDQWAAGEISIAQEHRATSTAYRLIGQMTPLFRHPGRRRGTVVVGSVSGDNHGLPSALLSDHLSDLRFDVVDLGGDTPFESFLEAAVDLDDLVGIGLCCIVDECAPILVSHAASIRDILPFATIVVGGPAASVADQHELLRYADVISRDTHEACRAFEAVVLEATTVESSP